jgi:hypothetical protein
MFPAGEDLYVIVVMHFFNVTIDLLLLLVLMAVGGAVFFT